MGFLLKFLGPLGWLVDPISKVVGEIANYQRKALAAKTEQERMVWRAKADAATNRLENLQSGERWEAVAIINASVRLGFALPFMIFLWKAIVFDKVLFDGWSTDPMSPEFWDIFKWVLIYFFGDRVLDKITGR